jgi:hypothetical protein
MCNIIEEIKRNQADFVLSDISIQVFPLSSLKKRSFTEFKLNNMSMTLLTFLDPPLYLLITQLANTIPTYKVYKDRNGLTW